MAALLEVYAPSEIAQAKLIIYVDQFEELFTSSSIDEKMQEEFIELLFKLFSSFYVWVVASMRSDFMSHLDKFPKLLELVNNGAEYKLGFPKQTEIGQIIAKPAREAGLNFEVDSNGKGLDDFLRESASKNQASLPLLEYLLDQLWEQRDQEKNQLTFEAYERLGGLDGAIGQKANAVYQTLKPHEQKAMSSLLIMFASMGEENNKITAKRVSKEQIEKNANLKACVKALLDQDVRLLISAKDDKGREYYRVAHEALFTHWELAQKTIARHTKDIQLRDQLEKSSKRWEVAKKEDKKSLLLQDGLPLNEAVDLLERRENELDVLLVAFVKASEKKVKRSKMITRLVWGTLLGVSLVVSFFMYGLMEKAENEKKRATTYRIQAEELIDHNLYTLRDELTKLGKLSLLQSTQDAVGAYYDKLGEEEHDPKTLYRIMVFHVNSGDIYVSTGNLKKVEEQYQKASEIAKRLAKIEPNNTGWQMDLLKSYGKFGLFYRKQNDEEKALSEFMKCVLLIDNILEKIPDNYQWKNIAKIVYNDVSTSYRKLDDEVNAEKFMMKAIEIMPNKNAELFTVLANEYYMKLKNFEKAREYYEEAYRLDINSSGFLNFYELQLITNEDMNESIEKNYVSNFKSKKEVFMDYAMLKIIKNITLNKKVDLEAWQGKYKDIHSDWGFSELDEWVETLHSSTLKDEALKKKINEALDVFKEHK